MHSWSTKDEQKRRGKALRAIHAGVQAGGNSVGQSWPGNVGTARVLGIPKQTLSNWVPLTEKGELQAIGDRPVSAEQMELAQLRDKPARVKMPS
jgi:hypothetical protein